jgi:acetolactate synthase-1/2/3 large subunit
MKGQIATLIVPSDYQLSECDATEVALPAYSPVSFETNAMTNAVQLLKKSQRAALLLGGQDLSERGLRAAARIKMATGCDLLANMLPSYIERGVGLPDVTRIPYLPDLALKLLSKYEAVVLVGAREPVTFFGYRGFPSYLLQNVPHRVTLAAENQNALAALESLADALRTPEPAYTASGSAVQRPAIPQGELTALKACTVIAALQPEGAIIVDEGNTSSGGYFPLGASLPRHTVLTITGGALGYGMPCALGAAIACPDRPVIDIQADGSAMYTVQALWTQAHERVNVTTLLCSNRSYGILKMELARSGIKTPGPKVLDLIDFDRPAINWVKMAESQGVPGVSVATAEGLARELSKALAEPGPHLIEMVLALRTG